MTTPTKSDKRGAPPLVESVLHPTDFSAASERAFAHALAISLLRGTRFTILHVGRGKAGKGDWTGFPAVRKTLERWGLLKPGSSQDAVFDELNVRVEKVLIESRFPTLTLVEHLDRDPHDLLVLATEGKEGVARWLRGSVAETVARSSRTMTLFVPAAAERGLVALADGKLTVANVLVPIDRDPDPSAAIELARRVAEVGGDGGVAITLLHVGDGGAGPAPDVRDGPGWTFKRVQRTGEPVAQIVAVAAEVKADLIVMATAGHHGVLDALRGSTTERVLRRAPCPLLAVPASGGR